MQIASLNHSVTTQRSDPDPGHQAYASKYTVEPNASSSTTHPILATCDMSDTSSSATPTILIVRPRTQVHLERLEPLEIRLHALLLACLGLKKGDAVDAPLFDPTALPWSDKKYSIHLTLERKHYKAEIDRRWVERLTKLSQDPPSLQNARPRPNGWSAAKLFDYLLVNPISVLEDVDYLVSLLQAETIKAHGQLQPSPVVGGTSSSY